MTVTDQVATDAPCMCGCAKWDHKQGRATCKHCGCDRYDPATFPEIQKLRDQVAQLERAVTVITAERDEAVLKANQAANKTVRLRTRCEELKQEANHAALQVDEAREQRNKAQAALADAEAALVEANEARRMRVSQEVHQQIAYAALVVDRRVSHMCLRCRTLLSFDDMAHRCGPLTPVDVIVARRPKEQP